ncbi:hypothetical protein A2U01_0098539, partial [Trifolium medium]|nr:hypothetical protein [Trifolium medium]
MGVNWKEAVKGAYT